jgi:hypothetical protein
VTVTAQSTISGWMALVSTGGALLGVLIGGLLSWLLQWLTESRHQRALVRAALRLTKLELCEASGSLEQAAGGYWKEGTTLPTGAWRAYREVLAVTLDRSDWETLAKTAIALNDLNAGLTRLGPGQGPQGAKLPQRLREELAGTRELLQAALKSWPTPAGRLMAASEDRSAT